MTTDSFVVKPLRFPGDRSASSRSTGRSTTWRCPAPVPWRSAFADPGGGLAGRELRAEVEAIAAPARGPASRSSPAIPRWSSAATATGCTSVRPESAAATRARACPRRRLAGRSDPAVRDRSGSTARRSCLRAMFSSSMPTSNPTPARCGRRRRAARRRRIRHPLPAGCHPGRRGVGPQRAGPGLVGGDDRA